MTSFGSNMKLHTRFFIFHLGHSLMWNCTRV